MSALVAAGADVEAADENGNTALALEAMQGNAACVSTLLAAGADVDAANKDSKTALMWAAMTGHKACVSLLLAAGADVEAANRDGGTALMLAARYGQAACVALLQGAARWRRRRPLALIREQRRAVRDAGLVHKRWEREQEKAKRARRVGE